MGIVRFTRTIETIVTDSGKTLSEQDVNEIIGKIPVNENPLFYVLRDSSILSRFDKPYFNARLEVVKALLDKSPELIDSTNAVGDRPIELAKALGDTQLIKLLTQKEESTLKPHR